MAICSKCGRSMCSCKLRNGVCATCRKAAKPTTVTKQKTAINNCDVTREILLTWKELLKKLISQNKYENVNLTSSQVSGYIVTLNISLNNPDDYCKFYSKLDPIKSLIPAISQVVS